MISPEDLDFPKDQNHMKNSYQKIYLSSKLICFCGTEPELCAFYEPQSNIPRVILGRVPRAVHSSSSHNLYNCTDCNDVNITVFLPKSERSKLSSISQIA